VAKTAVSDEEIQLRKRARRRLVGAIALVLLAVVFLPMVLDSEPRQRPQEVSIQIPAIPPQAPTPPAGQAATPAADASLSAPRPAVDSGTPSAPTVPSQEAAGRAVPDAKVVAPSRPTASQKPAAPASRPADTAQGGTSQGPAQVGEGYVVRLGAFRDTNNAKQMLAKLKANKIAGYSEVLKTAEGQRMRVRAGPFPSEESARAARDRLRQLKLIPASEGKIVRQGE
jgi:DedD protein